MKICELNAGDMFEFDSAGYCFKKCLFIGIDEYDNVNFVHMTASADRYILNNIPASYNPWVIKATPKIGSMKG